MWYYIRMWAAIGSFLLGLIIVVNVLFRWTFNWYWKFPVPYHALYIAMPLILFAYCMTFGVPKPLSKLGAKGICALMEKIRHRQREAALWGSLSLKERRGRYLDFTLLKRRED